MSPAFPVLYSFRRCPYAMRARLALLSSGTVCELREIELRNKPQALLEISPKATVPVLQLPSGEVLEQSLDIMLWALAQRDPAHWRAADPDQHAAQMAWIAQCDGEFKFHLDRYKYPNRYALPDGRESRAAGGKFLEILNSKLGATGNLGAHGWGLADAAIAPFVRQWAHTDLQWFADQPWPALQSWLQSFETSPAMAITMRKPTPWSGSGPGVLWPPTASETDAGKHAIAL